MRLLQADIFHISYVYKKTRKLDKTDYSTRHTACYTFVRKNPVTHTHIYLVAKNPHRRAVCNAGLYEVANPLQPSCYTHK